MRVSRLIEWSGQFFILKRVNDSNLQNKKETICYERKSENEFDRIVYTNGRVIRFSWTYVFSLSLIYLRKKIFKFGTISTLLLKWIKQIFMQRRIVLRQWKEEEKLLSQSDINERTIDYGRKTLFDSVSML